MKIIVNDVAASKGGALRILEDFYEYVATDEECKKHKWIFLVSGEYLESREHIIIRKMGYVKKSWLHRIMFDISGVAKIVKDEKADYVISLQNVISKNVHVPQAVYIHQSIPFQNLKRFSFWKKEERIYAIYQYIIGKIIKASAKKANTVIVQTEWMRNAVSQYSSCNIKKIITACPSFTQDKSTDLYSGECGQRFYKYFFYPAFDAVYKNQEVIDEACLLLQKSGITDFKVELTVDKKYCSKQIDSIGTISHEEVLKKYRKSVLIFPSYIETIGLPLIEAAQQGAIILSADCLYAHEVLKDYSNVYYFDPFDERELAKLMQDVLENKIVHKETNYVAYANLPSWETVIAKILNGDANELQK